MTERMAEVRHDVWMACVNDRALWWRARSSGERVTLAALWRAGYLRRRVWRKGKQAADNAHEYRPA